MTRIVKVIGDRTVGIKAEPICNGPTVPDPVGAGGIPPNVFVELSPVVLIGDKFITHTWTNTVPPTPHVPIALKGSTTVFINGQLIYTANGALTCADTVSPGTSTVWVEGPDMPL